MTDCKKWRSKLIARTERIVDDYDLVDLKNRPSAKRREWFNEIQTKKEEYEDEFLIECRNVPDAVKDEDLRRFGVARLKLAAAIEEDPNAGREEQVFVDQFQDDEIQFVRDFDQIERKFENVSKSQLESQIENQEGALYEFVEEEVRNQVEMRESLFDTGNVEIRGSAISYFGDKFEEYQELADEAAFLYIKHHGLPNTVEGIVTAADAAAEASEERERIEEALETQLEELSETIHHSLRGQERALRAEMGRLEAELGGNADAGALERELSDIRSQIEDLSERRERDVRAMSSRLAEIETLDRTLDEKIDELEETRRQTIEEVADETGDRARTLVEEELERLRDQKTQLTTELDRLRAERERMERTGDRITDDVESLEQSIPTGETGPREGKAIKAEIARLYERDYIGRFEKSVRDVDRIRLPDGETFAVPDGFWDGRNRHISGNYRQRVDGALDGDVGASADRYPLGEYSVFRVKTSHLVAFSKTKLVIEAVVRANLEAFAANGFDATPAGVEHLLDVVNDTLARAENEDTPHLIGIASPTGWTDEVKQLVRDEEYARTNFSRRVSVCLVDIQTDELVYDRNDPLVRENVGLFEREVDSERVERCAELIRSKYAADPATSHVTRHDLVDGHGFEPHIVKKAFDRLAANGVGRKSHDSSTGLCLFFDGV